MWQSIETAPRDGTSVLVYDVPQSKYGYVPSVPPSCLVVYWSKDSWEWIIANSFEDRDGDFPVASNPTHWMPLPPPPIASGEA